MAHIWLGLLDFSAVDAPRPIPLQSRTSTLAAVLMWLLTGVIVSGCWGLFVQNILPRVMLEQVPAETIFSQIGHILKQYGDEADQLVALTCGRQADEESSRCRRALLNPPLSYQVGGTVRKVGRVQGKVVQAGIETVWVADSEPLLAFHRQHINPYLRAESGRGLPLDSAGRAAELFNDLKTQLRPEAHPTVDRIAALCDQRRQFDLERRLHRWLHVWLSVHVPLSAALVGLMAAHVFFAFKYL